MKLENASGSIKNDDLDDKSAYEFLMKVYQAGRSRLCSSFR